MNFGPKIRIIINTLLLFAIALLAAVYFFMPVGEEHEVTLTTEGFTPKNLQVKIGEKVRFTTTLHYPFWPASDLHPSHALYPEFDPEAPILPGGSWSFVFEKPGTWKYHDHLNPLHRGTVMVVGEGSALIVKTECEIEQNGEECWRELLAETARTEGMDAAFDVFALLHDRESFFASNCHNHTHELGQVAYEEFKAGRPPVFTEKASYCGYGYYHGFMESLLHDSGDADVARRFCEGTKAQIEQGFGPQIEIACYHGIGHGSVEEGNLKKLMDAKLFVVPGLALCDIVADTPLRKQVCADGAYNSLANAITRDNLVSLLGDESPFDICSAHKELYFRKGCFHQLNTVIYFLGGGDFSKAAQYAEKIPGDLDAIWAMEGIATLFGASKQKQMDHNEVADICLKTQERLQFVCVRAYASGLIEGGEPEQEAARALSFCASKNLTVSLREECYKGLTSMLFYWFDRNKANNICVKIPKSFQLYCENEG